MCGIVGIISSEILKSTRDEILYKMNQDIHHRGPDEDGLYSDDYLSLGMKRLSIIDLKTGKQPIYSNNGEYLIFFNGEIYNYLELREELISDGYVFKTNSDTEVIINLYQKEGVRMIPRLRGMFAFCIYNLITKEIVIARDRFGEKPLFYTHQNNKFIFASEPKAILNTGLIDKKINEELIPVYLNRSFVPDPFTLIRDVYSLSPGSYLAFNNQSIEIVNYFQPQYTVNTSIATIDDAVDFINPFLKKAVQRQMISDVPLGAFLSGGIDSSSVVALMQQNTSKPIKTFTVKFESKGYDESVIARKVSERLNTEHHEIVLKNKNFSKEIFWKIIDHVGLPFPDSSAIPTDQITSEIVKQVTVAVSGDGGDEVFGGYTLFDWYLKLNRLSSLPSSVKYFIEKGLQVANGLNISNNKLRQFSKALKISKLDNYKQLVEMQALFESEEVEKLCKVELKNFYEIPKGFNELSLLRKAMLYRLKYNLPLDMLVKVDRMSMSNSLEVRAPLLDHDLFDAAAQLPEKFIRENGVGKLILRNAMKNILPEEVFNHPKSGFSIPLHDFQNEEFVSLASDLLLNNERILKYFNKDVLQSIFNDGLIKTNKDGTVYRKSHQLWSMMMLSGWMLHFDIH